MPLLRVVAGLVRVVAVVEIVALSVAGVAVSCPPAEARAGRRGIGHAGFVASTVAYGGSAVAGSDERIRGANGIGLAVISRKWRAHEEGHHQDRLLKVIRHKVSKFAFA